MKLPFLNRTEELARLGKAFSAPESTFVCLYGRRRCGKSRLLQQALSGRKGVYFVGDEREATLQRASLTKEISRLLPGFDRVTYHTWDDLFERWYFDAPPGAILALDEFPFLCAASSALPGILQKFVDRERDKPVHLALCGSSQRMMYGLVLDASAPLYGRAREIMKIEPLRLHFLQEVFKKTGSEKIIETFAAWGGVPRYWELALEYDSTIDAFRDLAVNPLGVLHREPERLLSDQMRDTRQAASLLSLIGQGCHRLGEIATRLEKPATSLTRPLTMLAELGLIRREVPFGIVARDSKRSLYKIADPFLQCWLKFVEPNRSLLEAGLIEKVMEVIKQTWTLHLGAVWEDLSRLSVPHLSLAGRRWGVASRWWSRTTGGNPGEIDIIAASLQNPDEVLVGEAKLTCSQKEINRLLYELQKKSAQCQAVQGKKITYALWIMKGMHREPEVVTAADVVAGLK